MIEDIQPTLDRVFLKVVPLEQKLIGKIIIPETVDNTELMACEVVAITEGWELPSGARVTPSAKKGDIVLIGKRAGVPIRIDDTKLLVVKDRDCWAILEGYTPTSSVRV
jgi:co-chaperonin GroES (HSP10)